PNPTSACWTAPWRRSWSACIPAITPSAICPTRWHKPGDRRHVSRFSVEQVLPPLGVALAQHAHQVPAGVQAERPRLPHQFHAGFLGSPAALAVVARVTAGHQVLPRRFTGARTRYYVIERQFSRGQRSMAILAGVAVAHQ